RVSMHSTNEITLRDDLRGNAAQVTPWRAFMAALNHPAEYAAGRQVAEWLAQQPTPEQFGLALVRGIQTLVSGGDAVAVRDASALIVHLPAELLVPALRAEPSLAWRRDFLLCAVNTLAPAAAVRLVEVAARAFDRPLAVPLRKLLRAMLRRCATDPAHTGSASLRGTLAAHVEMLCAERVHAVTHGFEQLYDRRREAPAPGRVTPGPERLVQLAIETGVVGRAVWNALAELVEADRGRDVVDLLKAVSEPNPATAAIGSRFATARELAQLLREEPVDFEAIDVLVRLMGVNAASTLLETLAESRSRGTRRGVFQRLASLGPEIGSFVEARLRDSRWFVLRNMLALLREAQCPTPPFVCDRFLTHDDARVRREAVLLLLREPRWRDRVFCEALKDENRDVVRALLQEARSGLPDAAVPVLAKRITDPAFPPELRVLALHLLGSKSSMLALDALLHYAQAGRTLFGKPRLAGKSPEMVAAVSGLARGWPGDRRVRALLDSAARSRDAEVSRAARPATNGR
ncbi:MAG: hypothetical protein ACRELX_17950, partial [Longimicrobiales bacterium]